MELNHQVIRRTYEDGLILEVVRYLLGEVTTDDEWREDENGDDILVPVTRFRNKQYVETVTYEYAI